MTGFVLEGQMPKSPSFQFYPADWLASMTISLMTPAEEGAYIRLLAYAWQQPDCGLPDDDTILAGLSRLGSDWQNGSSNTLRTVFVPVEKYPGRIFNIRLLSERKKQDEYHNAKRAAGVSSGKSRRKTREQRSVSLPIRSNKTRTNDEQKGTLPLPLPLQNTKLNTLSGEPDDLPLPKRGQTGDPEFEAIWAIYPADRRVDKQGCFKIYRKAVKAGVDPEEIKGGLELWLLSKQWADGFKQLSKTWFNGSFWEAEPEAANGPRKYKPLTLEEETEIFLRDMHKPAHLN
jgi:uncharacterized protein YdaU (DUF1376 family)